MVQKLFESLIRTKQNLDYIVILNSKNVQIFRLAKCNFEDKIGQNWTTTKKIKTYPSMASIGNPVLEKNCLFKRVGGKMVVVELLVTVAMVC